MRTWRSALRLRSFLAWMPVAAPGRLQPFAQRDLALGTIEGRHIGFEGRHVVAIGEGTAAARLGLRGKEIESRIDVEQARMLLAPRQEQLCGGIGNAPDGEDGGQLGELLGAEPVAGRGTM